MDARRSERPAKRDGQRVDRPRGPAKAWVGYHKPLTRDNHFRRPCPNSPAPLGTVVIGGLLVSTMLTLLVIPTLYFWASKHVEPRFGGFNQRVAASGDTPVPEQARSY